MNKRKEDDGSEAGSDASSLHSRFGQTYIGRSIRWLTDKNSNRGRARGKNHTHIRDHKANPWVNYSDYEFTHDIGLMLLPKKFRKAHNFVVYNVTLPTHQCFGSDLVQLALPSDGLDVVVLNMVSKTFKTTGYLKAAPYNEIREISSNYYTQFSSFATSISNRISILVRSLFSFLFVSTTTSLMIRVLVSSGVVILFPIFWLFTVLLAYQCLFE